MTLRFVKIKVDRAALSPLHSGLLTQESIASPHTPQALIRAR